MESNADCGSVKTRLVVRPSCLGAVSRRRLTMSGSQYGGRQDTRSRRAIIFAVALALGCVAGCAERTEDDNINQGSTEVQLPVSVMDGVRILDRHPNGSPRFVAGSFGNVGQLSADDATASLQLRERIVAPLALFDLVPGDLVFWRVTRDETGARHFRFKQVHEGLDVLGADLVVHVRANGELFAINGTAHGRFRWSKASRTLAVPDAVRLAARHAKVSGLNVTFVREVYFQSAEGVNYLALELDASPDGGPPVARVYVDATGDAVLAVHSLTRTARFRGVYDAHHHTDNSKLPGTLRRAEGDVPSADSEVNTLYDKLGDVHDAYLSIFGRDSYDDSGGTIHASVHYGANVCNAKFTHYWSWLPPWSYGRILVFGDGDGVGCLPLGRALDVVAHEFAHWASEHDVGLNGSGEPDAIDEGLADVFGLSRRGCSAEGTAPFP